MLALLMYFGNGSESASCQAVRYESGGALAIRLSRVLFRLPLNTCSGTGYIEYTIGPGLATGGVGHVLRIWSVCLFVPVGCTPYIRIPRKPRTPGYFTPAIVSPSLMSLNTSALLPRKLLVDAAAAAAWAGSTRKAVAAIPSAPAAPIKVRRLMFGAAGWSPGSLSSRSTACSPVSRGQSAPRVSPRRSEPARHR